MNKKTKTLVGLGVVAAIVAIIYMKSKKKTPQSIEKSDAPLASVKLNSPTFGDTKSKQSAALNSSVLACESEYDSFPPPSANERRMSKQAYVSNCIKTKQIK